MLREALIELVLEKGIEGITVNEITERAMINRSTFYRHYEDKNDLLERGIDEMLLELTDQLVPPPKDIREVDLTDPGSYNNLRLFYNHVKEHYNFYRVMLGENGPPGFRIKTLGPEIDIHTGGIDNVYRHHDYNRAIMESYSKKTLARYWYHCEHLIVEGEKMSKSKGNTLYPENAYEWGCTPRMVRYMLLSAHYREKLNVQREYIQSCSTRIKRIQDISAAVTGTGGEKAAKSSVGGNSADAGKLAEEIPLLFRAKMNDDLKYNEVIECLEPLMQELDTINRKEGIARETREKIDAELKAIDKVLGVLFS
jgi:AcrR family transcriptional regulator